MSLACRLHPRPRTYRCDAANRRFGPFAVERQGDAADSGLPFSICPFAACRRTSAPLAPARGKRQTAGWNGTLSRRGQRGRGDEADAGDRLKSLAGRVRSMPSHQPILTLGFAFRNPCCRQKNSLFLKIFPWRRVRSALRRQPAFSE